MNTIQELRKEFGLEEDEAEYVHGRLNEIIDIYKAGYRHAIRDVGDGTVPGDEEEFQRTIGSGVADNVCEEMLFDPYE